MLIGTHDGKFHADEVFACATLLILHPDAKIIRTREERILSTCNMRVDVGMKYDPETGDFDHHQDAVEVRSNGVLLSSFGLVWRHFGLRVCEGRADIYDLIDMRLVQPIDASDNRQFLFSDGTPNFKSANDDNISHINISQTIGLLNHGWDDVEKQGHIAFMEAVTLARRIILASIRNLKDHIDSKEKVLSAIRGTLMSDQPKILVLKQGLPWIETLFEFERIQGELTPICYTIFPGDDGGYMIQAVPLNHPRNAQMRAPFPETWLDPEFRKQNGILFCHRGRHLSKTRTLDQAIELVSGILNRLAA